MHAILKVNLQVRKQSYGNLCNVPSPRIISKFKLRPWGFTSNAHILHPYTFQTSIIEHDHRYDMWPKPGHQWGAAYENHGRRWLQGTVNGKVWSRSKENQRPYCDDFVFQVTKWKAIEMFAFSSAFLKDHLRRIVGRDKIKGVRVRGCISLGKRWY